MYVIPFRDTGKFLPSIICFFKEHVWELVGIECHYDSSQTQHYRCSRCTKAGSACL